MPSGRAEWRFARDVGAFTQALVPVAERPGISLEELGAELDRVPGFERARTVTVVEPLEAA